MAELQGAPLGEKSAYIDQYDPNLLFQIPRKTKRDEIDVSEILPFSGWDIWNAYEISWLDAKGKPQVAIGEFYIVASTPCIVESKSFKLYLNSYNNTKFANWQQIEQQLKTDLEQVVQGEVRVKLCSLDAYHQQAVANFTSKCLDDLDVECEQYQPSLDLLREDEHAENSGVVHSHLLKSNCLVTAQPDWASIEIAYSGARICHASLLKYIVSFRNHNEFHEQCVERMFMDISRRFSPEQLTIYARYTRRGGLDINPIRSTEIIDNVEFLNQRQTRQ